SRRGFGRPGRGFGKTSGPSSGGATQHPERCSVRTVVRGGSEGGRGGSAHSTLRDAVWHTALTVALRHHPAQSLEGPHPAPCDECGAGDCGQNQAEWGG